MGHLLAFNGSIYVTTPSGYELPSAGLWFCEFEAEQTTQTSSALVVIRGSSNLYIGFESDGRLRIWFVTSGGNVTYNLNIPLGRNVVRVGLDFDTNSLSVLVNGVQELGVIESRIPLLSGSRNIVFSDWFGVRRFIGNLYYANINGQRYYNPSTSGGTGLILPDDVSFADGSIKNGHSDDRHFVYYDDGTSEPAPEPQPVTTVTAVQQDVASSASVSQSQDVIAIVATQQDISSQLNIEQEQAVSRVVAEQIDSATSIDIESAQGLAPIIATQQDIVPPLTIEQQQAVASVVAQQVDFATTTDVESIQAVTYLVAVQQDEASPVSIEQSDAQLVSVVTAVQQDKAVSTFVSQVDAVDILTATQQDAVTSIDIDASQSIAAVTAVQQDTAEQVIINVMGEFVDISNYVLTPVTKRYSITPINKTNYSISTIKTNYKIEVKH